ncbi:hypothetical protein GCM10023215_38730 [Pseudonocardia yuanmonensis]|uniref:N,N-dimethylformamidase alpha subunit domain-containing protein n=1 Tax=Pseudonocardia yuanmonensis TaxID=1095914 RepID=A0ABP8WYW0_9PSEU
MIVAVRPWEEYRLAALTGVHGEAPEVLDDRPYATEEEAMHAVFLRRVADLVAAHSSPKALEPPHLIEFARTPCVCNATLPAHEDGVDSSALARR